MYYNLYCRKKFITCILVNLIVIILLLNLYTNDTVSASQSSSLILNESYDETELKSAVNGIYNKRSSAFVTGDLLSLKELFDTSQKHGKRTLEHEIKRVKYLKDWSKEREIKFTNVQSTVRIKKIYPVDNIIKLALEESYKFDYIYPQDEEPITNSFGVGIRHTLSLIKKADKWVVYNDWYTDCFEDALQAYGGDIKENLTQPTNISNNSRSNFRDILLDIFGTKNYTRPYYNREKASEYADKYCGAAWGSGNNFKYNKKYRDFNGIGGDCTNFTSQILGDKEGGGLPMDSAWYCHYSQYGNGQGTFAWVNADGLKDYLIYSGRGSVVKKGTFKELTLPSPNNPNGAVQNLQLADLICYEKKGDIDHFAVITDWDSHGYPLINSHTTDRYHVPWDLGWGDNKIRFFLIHINE